MRCLAALAALTLAAVPALADPKAKPALADPKAKPALADPKAKPAAVKLDELEAAGPAKPATCKRRVVGRGLDRKVICEFEEPIVVGVEPSKPKVIIAPVDPRRVVGRPKQTDPFAGLSRRRSTAL
jgi:hypothetical protein